MKIKILCTLGPASLKPEILRGLDERGADLYRINLSHTPIDQVEPTIELIRTVSQTPIALDTEGAQVRCGYVAEGVTLVEGQEFMLTGDTLIGDHQRVSLWPRVAFETMSAGALVGIDFDGLQMRVDAVGDGSAVATVLRGGRVRSNKAVTIEPAPDLPALSDKDHDAIEIGARAGDHSLRPLLRQ